LGAFPETHGAGRFREDGRNLRFAGCKQVRDSRQTTGNITRFRRFLRDACTDVAHHDVLAVFDHDYRIRRQTVSRRDVSVGEVQLVTVVVQQFDDRTQILVADAARFGIGHHQCGYPGNVVNITFDGHPFDEFLEFDPTGHFRDDRMGIGIPVGQPLTDLDGTAFADMQVGTIGHLVAFGLAVIVVHDTNFTRARHRHQMAFLGVLDGLDVVQLGHTGVLGFDAVGRNRARSRTTDVERAHGQLRTGLADGLRGYHTNRFTDGDALAAGQIATITLGADTERCFTGDRAAHQHLVHGVDLQLVDFTLGEQYAGLHQGGIICGINDIACQYAPEHSLTQRLHHITTFDDGLNLNASLGA